MKPDFFVSSPTGKTFIQYKIPSPRTLAVKNTISWSRGSLHRKSCTYKRILNFFLHPHLRNWCWKPFSGILLFFVIIIVVVVDDDTYYWVYWSSDHSFQVYCIVWQLLFQSATEHSRRKLSTIYMLYTLKNLSNFPLTSPWWPPLHKAQDKTREDNSIVFHLSFLTHSACQYDVT